jgi:hypothetical protein
LISLPLIQGNEGQRDTAQPREFYQSPSQTRADSQDAIGVNSDGK